MLQIEMVIPKNLAGVLAIAPEVKAAAMQAVAVIIGI
jgi:hypothetical protein